MTTPVPRSQAPPDAMPTTRGLDFYAADPNLEFVCSAGPSTVEFGLLCPVSLTDSTARMLRRFGDPAPQPEYLPRLKISLAWLDAIVDWTPVPADALGSAGPLR
jgi:hypothetical protein